GALRDPVPRARVLLPRVHPGRAAPDVRRPRHLGHDRAVLHDPFRQDARRGDRGDLRRHHSGDDRPAHAVDLGRRRHPRVRRADHGPPVRAEAVMAPYVVLLSLLGAFAAHRLALVAIYLRRRALAPPPPHADDDPPGVTVPVPLYNEAAVAERLLDAAAAIDWPRDRLEIQVLDDSTDETTALVAAKVAALRARGVDATHLRRGERVGFKAGALEHGLASARRELRARFVAGLVPGPVLLARATGSLP